MRLLPSQRLSAPPIRSIRRQQTGVGRSTIYAHMDICAHIKQILGPEKLEEDEVFI